METGEDGRAPQGQILVRASPARVVVPHCGSRAPSLSGKCRCGHACMPEATRTHPEVKLERTALRNLQKGSEEGFLGTPGPTVLCSPETCLPDPKPCRPECDAVFAVCAHDPGDDYGFHQIGRRSCHPGSVRSPRRVAVLRTLFASQDLTVQNTL